MMNAEQIMVLKASKRTYSLLFSLFILKRLMFGYQNIAVHRKVFFVICLNYERAYLQSREDLPMFYIVNKYNLTIPIRKVLDLI